MKDVIALAQEAKKAGYLLGILGEEQKNKALFLMAEALLSSEEEILAANERDLQRAREKGTGSAMLDRLALNSARVAGMAEGIRKVAALKDPVGEVMERFTAPGGMEIEKRRVPFGVVGIIYEARPNVTSDAAALCIKTGNAVVLKGGSEAIESNLAVARALQAALKKAGLPETAIGMVEDTSREAAKAMMQANGLIDVLIPRGGAGLIRAVVQNATVPVIETGVGNCHVYVDESAELSMAERIVINAKTSRPAVCNAIESLLVHESLAEEFLPRVFAALKERGVEIRGDEICQRYGALPATEEDYRTEFLDYIISVKVVGGVQEAVEHINKYGTRHSECIVTQNQENAAYFTDRVDAAAVYVNASTRFTDGEEFGFGAEIGISTQKLHARGPMGPRELTSYKYIVKGTGQIR